MGAVSTAAATGCPGGWRLLCVKTAVLSTAIKERLILRMCFCHFHCPSEV